MNRTILVPIDISDSELTQRVISHVEAEAKIDDAEVHFLTVIPSLPYYASLGLAYSAELPAMDDLKAEAKSQLEEIIKKFKLPTDRGKRAARTVLTGMCYSVGSATRRGEQFADPVYRPVGYDVKDIAEVAFWLHSVQFARPDQAVQQRSPLSSMIRTEEQVVFAAQTDHPQRIFSDVIVRLSPAIICIVRQRRPLVQGVCERFRQF